MPDKRPNILLIMSDEHDPAVTGCYGDRVVQTPNLDRLAAQGVTFDGCYTNSPLCVPARLSFHRGGNTSAGVARGTMTAGFPPPTIRRYRACCSAPAMKPISAEKCTTIKSGVTASPICSRI